MKCAGTPSREATPARCWFARLRRASLLTAVLVGATFSAFAQDPAETPAPAAQPPEQSSGRPLEDRPAAQPDEPRENSPTLMSLPRNLFLDQKDFWTTPFHMTKTQWRWTVPLTFAGAGLFGVDTAAERHVPTTHSTVTRAASASNAGLAALVGAGGGMFLYGHFASNDQARETGLLSGEAAIDAFLDTTAFKFAFGRERPFTGSGKGHFFQGGASFPSEHASVSWAIASVIAHEYPGPLTQILAYGVAGGVSAARVAGQKHFVADALVGSALGWYLGRQVYKNHSLYSAADIARYGRFSKGYEPETTGREVRNMGSTYLPFDSWVYPALDRLIAAGYVRDRTQTLRPWTRLECARMLAAIHDGLANDVDDSSDPHLLPLVADLDLEFARETDLRNGETPNAQVELESVYSRYTNISGRPLRDSFHFGQTLANDFGRPYGQGSNAISGVSANASVGPFLLYFRGEYQYGSSNQEYTPTQAAAVAGTDLLPVNSVPTFGKTSRLRPIEFYVGLNLSDWQFTFGQQSLWWGANRSTSLLLSNNAEAIPMLRVDRTSPLRLPSVLGWLGPMQVSGFIGRLGGYRYLKLGQPGPPPFHSTLYGDGIHPVDPQPFIWGANIAFKPTQNLELGFSLTAVFAGHGRPLTLKTFLHTLSQHGNFQPLEPGDRSPTISAAYKLPYLRNLVTVYADSMSETQPFPLFYPKEAALNAGIYFTHVPQISNLDLRVEGIYTNIPGHQAGNNSYFVNSHYAEGDRNYGQLFTSWIGRGGTGGEGSATYWFSARNRATFTFRRLVSNRSLLEGGNMNDFSTSIHWMVRPQVEVAGSVQYERWNFPFLHPGPMSNISTAIEIRVWPKLHLASARSALGGRP